MFTEVSLGLLKHLITDGVMEERRALYETRAKLETKQKAGIETGGGTSDTDSKPTSGRLYEPLTSLKLTIIGHAPLASGALRGELAATAVNAPMVPAELAFPIAVLEHKYIKLICTGYLDSATEEAMEEFRRFEEEM
ncbi:hypothetical protein Tco_0667164 [Tanacetum coccineum]